MNSKFFLLILSIIFTTAFNYSLSAPGDTTRITIFDKAEINAYGSISATATLPAATESFHKIRLLYKLGRRSCPGEQWCGSWDYTTSVYAKNAASDMDSLELMRVITPYATDWPITRTHTYVEEVTDYSSILHDDVDFTYFYEGYSWGFTLTLTLEMIEGEAPRKAVDVKNIYDGHYQYGNNSNPIENHLIEKSFAYNGPATTAVIKNLITGHGMDNTGCSEFCSKWYRQKVNGSQIKQVQLWKNDCGLNHVSPQTGTWVYDRANWCPGEWVRPIYHDLSEYTTAGEDFTVDMDMQPYTAGSADVPPNYYITSQLFTYEDPTYQLDAAIVDILSPTNNENYARYNPACSNPIIKIRNEGAENLTSVRIAYKVENGVTYYHDWEGNLGLMEEEIVQLNGGFSFITSSPSNTFIAEIIRINGQTSDEVAWNNSFRSTFEPVASYPETFRIGVKTNHDYILGGKSETTWRIIDENGEIVMERSNNDPNTTYYDTVSLETGCYTFIMDDAGCDGISWWANSAGGNGIIKFFEAESNATLETLSGDFGCQLVHNFTIGGTMGVEEADKNDSGVILFPNPAKNTLTLQFESVVNNINYQIYDPKGSVLLKQNNISTDNNSLVINTQSLGNGMYFIKGIDSDKKGKFVKKFFIQK